MSMRSSGLPEVLDAQFQFSISNMMTKWDFHLVDLDQYTEVSISNKELTQKIV